MTIQKCMKLGSIEALNGLASVVNKELPATDAFWYHKMLNKSISRLVPCGLNQRLPTHKE